MTIETLDTDQQCFFSNGKPTPYFENLWFELVESLGGEGTETIIDTLVVLANYPEELASVQVTVKKLQKQLDAVQLMIDDVPLGSQVAQLRKTVNALAVQLERPVSLKAVYDRIGNLEKQVTMPVNLKPVYDRLAAIEAQL